MRTPGFTDVLCPKMFFETERTLNRKLCSPMTNSRVIKKKRKKKKQRQIITLIRSKRGSFERVLIKTLIRAKVDV